MSNAYLSGKIIYTSDEACTMGIRAAIEFKVKFLNVYGNSALVMH